MTSHRPTRRTFLAAATAAGVGTAVAGCLDGGLFGSPGATDDVVLDPPDEYDQLREARDADALVHPIHGDELPEATVPAPLADRTITTTEFVGERHVLLTFVFTRCPGVCLMLTANLAQVQADAIAQGYTDEVALFPVTFDPVYDTPAVLRDYEDARGADRTVGNWFFLRPETEQQAKEVVEDRFGVFFDPLSPEEREEMEMHENMAFQHLAVIMLANADGYVERTYVGAQIPNPGALVEDVRTLRERW